ncbi:hypothetical protein D3C75_1099780 [compost metagenome]
MSPTTSINSRWCRIAHGTNQGESLLNSSGSSKLCPVTINAPSTSNTPRDRCRAAARTIMQMPMHQITCNHNVCGTKVPFQARLTRVSSSSTRNRPRLSRNIEVSRRLCFWL